MINLLKQYNKNVKFLHYKINPIFPIDKTDRMHIYPAKAFKKALLKSLRLNVTIAQL